MTIQDMIDQLTIQGAYCIKQWHEEDNDCVVLEEGRDFENEWYKFSNMVMNTKISYMYVVDNCIVCCDVLYFRQFQREQIKFGGIKQ